jgi:hypothetical protein
MRVCLMYSRTVEAGAEVEGSMGMDIVKELNV